MAAERVEDDVASNGSEDQTRDVRELEDPRSPEVVTKYRTAGEIAHEALRLVEQKAVAGAKVVDLCCEADALIELRCSKIYNKKSSTRDAEDKITKGVGFPCCVSVNEVVGSFSPLLEDESKLAAGDVVKVDVGVNVDGYLAMVAHTFVVPGEKKKDEAADAEKKDEAGGKITGKKADLLAALATVSDAVQRMMRPGNKNTDVTKIVARVCEDFGVTPLDGVTSHEVTRFVIDGEKRIDNAEAAQMRAGIEKTKVCEFEPNDVWSVDVVLSTGEGKPHASETRTTVHKRVVENQYRLKMKASRTVLSEVEDKFPVFPFTMRSLTTDLGKRKFGIVECVTHQVLEEYPVLLEKDGEFVGHIKFTVIITNTGAIKVTGVPIDLSNVKSERSVKSAEVKKVLALGLPYKKKNKNKKKKKKK